MSGGCLRAPLVGLVKSNVSASTCAAEAPQISMEASEEPWKCRTRSAKLREPRGASWPPCTGNNN